MSASSSTPTWAVKPARDTIIESRQSYTSDTYSERTVRQPRFSTVRNRLIPSVHRQSTTSRLSSPAPAANTNRSSTSLAERAGICFSWVRGELIGKGSYGRVYLALNATTGEIIAVKQVELPSTSVGELPNVHQKEVIEALQSESDMLANLEHPNIVQYLGFEDSPRYLSIFLEYIPGGSVGSCLHNHGRFDENTTKSFASQILNGLEYLHSRGIIHRDLKADNILVERSGIAKISDFGISKHVVEEIDPRAHTELKGTIYWMAPEVVRPSKSGYDTKVDIWSVGCIIVEMWTGRRPWHGLETIPVMLKLARDQQPPPLPADFRLSKQGQDLRKKCFAPDPMDRPSAAELQHHVYLRLPPGWQFDPKSIDGPSARRRSVRKSKMFPTHIKPSKNIPPVPQRIARSPAISLERNNTLRPRSSSASNKSNDKLRIQRPLTPPKTKEMAPPIVVITPTKLPQHRHSGSNPSESPATSESATSSRTPTSRRKSFRVVNPDSDSESESSGRKEKFIYKPPPLPPLPPSSEFVVASGSRSSSNGISSQYSPHSSPSPNRHQPQILHHRSQPSLKASSLSNSSDVSHLTYTEEADVYYSDSDSDSDASLWNRPPADIKAMEEQRPLEITDKRKSYRHSQIESKRASAWARPKVEDVYGRLEDYFPDHDLDTLVPAPSVQPDDGKLQKRRTLRMAARQASLNKAPRRRTTMWGNPTEEMPTKSTRPPLPAPPLPPLPQLIPPPPPPPLF